MSSRSFRDRYGAALGAVAQRPPEPSLIDEWPLPLGARLLDTPDGPCAVLDRVYDDATTRHARELLDHGQRPARHDHLHCGDLLFLDTETTGLSGGTGTHVFLVGIGRFHDTALHVRQFFMSHPGNERALLSMVARYMCHGGSLVTYNGRTFDVPLLETRFTIHGRVLDRPKQHLDLLPAARSIWKHRLPNCSLSTIERVILGVVRERDSPGWMIPQLYFDYLRSRRIEFLEPVIEHNRTDIISLARLTALVRAYEDGITTPAHDIDRLAVALHRLKRCASDSVVDDLKSLWTVPTIPVDLRLRALRELSRSMKRTHRHSEAVAQWRAALNDPSRSIRLYAIEELAKHLEHVERDAGQAREITLRGVDSAVLADDDAALEAFQRRLRRLERKLQSEHLRKIASGSSG